MQNIFSLYRIFVTMKILSVEGPLRNSIKEWELLTIFGDIHNDFTWQVAIKLSLIWNICYRQAALEAQKIFLRNLPIHPAEAKQFWEVLHSELIKSCAVQNANNSSVTEKLENSAEMAFRPFKSQAVTSHPLQMDSSRSNSQQSFSQNSESEDRRSSSRETSPTSPVHKSESGSDGSQTKAENVGKANSKESKVRGGHAKRRSERRNSGLHKDEKHATHLLRPLSEEWAIIITYPISISRYSFSFST